MAGGSAALGEVLTAATLEALFERSERLRQRVADVLAQSRLPLCVTGMGSIFTILTVRGP